MNAQELLQSFLRSPDGRYWEPLSEVVSDLVHRSAARREIADLEDFEEDCLLAIWTKIGAIKAGESESAIENLEAFVRRAVHNRYCDAIRRKRPAWYNLKLELLELFSGRANVEGFALWQDPETGARLCGFREWDGRSGNASARVRDIAENLSGFREKYLRNRDPGELATHELAAIALDFCGGPLDVDALTSLLADLTHAHVAEPLSVDAQPDSDDDTGAPVEWLISAETDVEKQVVDTGWFNHVVDWFWKEFLLLSLKQRKAILYGMSGDQVMALGSAVGLAEVAGSLETSSARLVSLVDELPLPDAATAEELGIQARAVPSVRFKAWGRIRRRAQKSTLTLEDEEALV